MPVEFFDGLGQGLSEDGGIFDLDRHFTDHFSIVLPVAFRIQVCFENTAQAEQKEDQGQDADRVGNGEGSRDGGADGRFVDFGEEGAVGNIIIGLLGGAEAGGVGQGSAHDAGQGRELFVADSVQDEGAAEGEENQQDGQ